MNAFRNTVRSAPAGALARAPALQLGANSRLSQAHRRLLSDRRLALGADAARSSQPSISLASSTTQPFLRSQFLPESLPLRASWVQSRSFHITGVKPQQAEDKTKPAPKPETEPAKSDESADDAAKAKSESAAEDQAEQKEKKDDESAEEGDKKKEEKKEDLPPPPPHGDKTPWQVFMETMQTEFKQSKEWNESTKALSAGAQQFTESESVQRARKAYEATSGAVSSTASTVLKGTASAVGKGAAWTWETPVMKGVRKGANITGDALDKATKPIRETEAYKNVKDVIDDGSSSRYGGWVEKEERRKRREAREKLEGKQQVFEEDPDAGTNVTLHKDAAWKEAWRDFRDSNKFVQGVFSMKNVYNESENPLISTARSITDRVAGFFAENETAMVIKKMRTLDPSFQVEGFLRELREYILPEVLDAYVKGDTETLKLWLSEAQYSVYEALTKQYLQAGMKSDGRILDIRHVDILKARMLEPGEIPVFIITCRTQEVHVYRNAKTNQLAAGMEDKVQLVTYAIGITRMPDDVNNPETRGWRLIEMQKSGRDYI